jgi:DNA-binding Lrp family transcriptional regulator
VRPRAFDIIDLKIIDVLQARCRVASSQIAENVGLSKTAVYNRLKRIERSAVIRNFSSRLELRRVLHLQILFTSMSLEDDRPDELRKCERQVANVPKTVQCYHLTGSVDYLLKSLSIDLDTYLGVINLLRDENANIRRYETSAQVREVQCGALPLERLVRRKAALTRM